MLSNPRGEEVTTGPMKSGVMTRKLRSPLLALVLGVWLWPAAARADVTTDPDSASVSNVSGYTGKKGDVKAVSLDWGLKTVTWYEKADKPCKLTISARDLYDPDKLVATSDYELDICGGAASNKKLVSFTDSRRNFIRGVAVCTTDKKDSSDNRLKGIKIFAAKVTTDGQVTELTTFEKNEHTNCAKWRKAVYCPAGHVAHGIQIHHTDGYFRGLAVKCRKVITKRSVKPPTR